MTRQHYKMPKEKEFPKNNIKLKETKFMQLARKLTQT